MASELPRNAVRPHAADDPLVFYRDPSGAPPRWPTAAAPRTVVDGHAGDGGASVVPYHGLRFDGSGACVHNPHGDGRVPQAAKVKSYPLVERWSALWIWMGDAQRADPELIPAFPFNDPEHWAVGTGSMIVDARYELEIDNILDLAHRVHAPLFSSDAVRRGEVECVQDGQTVWSKRFMPDDTQVPDFLRQAFQLPAGAVDRWLHVRWNAPASLALWAGGVASGRAQA
jgi:vanillate O-demethylase monooxygenase subunit